jgi:hypothetical protein
MCTNVLLKCFLPPRTLHVPWKLSAYMGPILCCLTIPCGTSGWDPWRGERGEWVLPQGRWITRSGYFISWVWISGDNRAENVWTSINNWTMQWGCFSCKSLILTVWPSWCPADEGGMRAGWSSLQTLYCLCGISSESVSRALPSLPSLWIHTVPVRRSVLAGHTQTQYLKQVIPGCF